jgi:hypothetical protein
LGAISIISANNVAGAADASAPTAAITAASLNQSAGYGKTVLGAVTTAGNISLTLTDLDFDGVVLDGGILNIYTQGGTGTIGLGSATGTLTLSNADLQHIRNATIINIGRSGNQSGLITATSAQFYSGISNLAAVNINSDFSTGTISLSDNTNTALDLNGNANIVLTLSSGTGGITATNNNGTNASISNTGAGSTTVLKTNSAGATSLGGIGANARIIFSNGSQPVQIVNNNGSGTVALGSLGPQALTIGGAGTSVTGNRTLNVTTASGDLTLASQISSGTGDISLSPAGNVNFAYSSLPIITQTTANLTIARPVILQADATITQVTGSGLDTIQFQSTIDSQNSTARALTVTGAGDNVIIAGATGASNQLSSLTVTSGAVISVYNVGNSATPSAGVATLSVTADTTGSIIFSGSYYQTGGNQSWIAGTSATPRSLTTLGATSWYTQATLAVEGNLTSATSQTFYSNDINLGGYGAWNWGSSNTLHFYTYTPSTQMNVGYDDGNSAHWNLSGSDITCLDAAATTGGTIAFGQSGTQYGLIYFKTADFSAANSGAGVAIVANSDTYSGPTYGAVSFDSGGSGVALKSGTKNITINAYQTINGVTRDGHGHLSTTGDISLNVNAAAGVYIGTGPLTFTLPIQIVTGTSGPTVNASGNTPQGVWLEGVGSGITLGTVNITGSIHTDLYSGGTIYLTQDIDSGGQSIIFSNPVQIYPSSGSSITLTTEGGNVIFSSTFDEYSGSSAGKDSLTIVAGTGGVTFADALGGTNAIGSLTISSAGVVTVSKGITTANAGSVSITHSGVLSLIDFTSLSDTSTPDLNLAGAFLENGTGSVQISADITTANAAITFNTPVQLTGSVLLNAGSGSIAFQINATIDKFSGATYSDLIVDSTGMAAGTITFGTAIGASSPIASLTTGLSAPSTVSGGFIKTSGAQNYNGPMTISANNLTLTSTNNGAITFGSSATVNGGNSLSIGNGTGAVTFGAAVGVGTPLTSLTISSTTGTTVLNGGTIATSGTQTYDDPVTLGAATTLTTTNSAVTFGSAATVNGAYVLSIGNGTGLVTFGAAVGGSAPLASLTISSTTGTTVLNGGTITTIGLQSYGDPVTLGVGTTLTTTSNGNVTFGSAATLNGAYALGIGNGTGVVTFGAVVGGSTRLTSLTISSTTGTTVLNGGTITTSGTQTYDDQVTLGAATTLTTTNSAVTFGSAATVNGGYALSIGNGTGVVTFGAAVGVGTPLASLTISSTTGTTVLNGGLIVTSGPQSYDDPVLLGAGTTFTTSNSNIAFAATVNPSVAPGQTLTLIAGSGAVTIGGTIGASSLRLGALQITSAADASFGGAIYGTSFTQVAGIGTTTFNALQNYAGNFSFAGTNLTVNAAWTVGGATTVTNSGVFTTAASNAAPLASSGPFTQANNGGTGTSSLGSSITTTNTNISFANPIVLASGIQLSTQASAGAGNITLSSTVDAVTAGAGAQGLTLAAGTGSITASGNIGAVVPLGALTVTSAANATFTGTVTAASFTQVAGTGKTTFNALQNYTGNFSFAGTNLTVNAAWTVGGTTTVTNAGVFATAIGNAALTSAGAFTQGGTGGSNSLGSNITTTNAAISFGDPIVLTSGIQLSTQASAGAGNITLSNTVDATSTNSPGQGLALTAGSGSVTFSNHVGATTRLASMNVIAAAITLDGSVLTTGAQEYSGSTSVVGSLSGSVVNAANALLWFNGPVTHTGGSINAGANTTSSPPDVAIRFSDDYIGSSPAVLNGNSAASGVEFDGNATLPGNNVGLPGFNRNGDSLLFKGAALQTFDSNAQLIGNVTIDDGIGVEIVGHSVYQTGGSFATTINSGYLDVVTKGSSVGWVADSAVGTAATVGLFDGIAGSLVFGTGTGTAARELRCVSLTTASGFAITNTDSNTITASGNMIIAGGFSNPLSPAAATATLVMTGTGVALTATPQIGNLTVTGSISLDSALLMYGSMKIASGGTLNVSPENCNITIEGDWSNSGTFVPANGTVLPGTGTVSFTKPTSRDSGIIYVSGNNNWYVFDCEVNGISVYFEKNNTQSILQNGSFRILSSSSSSVITLSRNDSDQASDLDWLVAVPPDPTKMWQINVNPGATVDMDNVMVKYSDAREHPIAKPAGVKLFVTSPATPPPGYTYLTCYEWISGILAVYSYAEDSDGDGKIDRIRVVAQSPLDGNFSGFTAVVSDYTIDTSKGTNGFEMVPAGQALPSSPTLYGGYGYEFWIHLVEKPYNDTGVTLSWAISNNTSLKDDSTGKYYLYTIASPLEFSSSIFMKTIDTAAPRVAYTLAIPGSSTVFFHFSEPVYGSTTDGAVSPSDFIGATGMTPVTTASDGIGVSEALVIYPPNAFSALDILNGQLLNLSTMYDYMPPSPPDDYATDSTWTPFWAALGGLPPHVYNSATSSASWPTPIASTTHRVSDVLVSVPIGSGTGQYFLWPIYAKDQVDVSLSDAQIANLTPAESAAQGIGLIRAFDGSQWLRAQDITVQASLLPALSPLSGCTLWFDTGVPAGLENSGLWLPAFAQTGFSGLVPYPNASPWGRGASPTSGVAASSGSNLWNFKIPKSDPRIVSGSTLDFFLTLQPQGSGQPLYGLRLDMTGTTIPNDWYRLLKPFSFQLHNVTLQRGSVTILNNVIDPTKGETVRLSYNITQAGMTTITVFTLDGDVVKRLYMGNQSVGNYSTYWDGTNLSGSVVARGIYFIRVVAPGVDEIRKVMVVRKL